MIQYIHKCRGWCMIIFRSHADIGIGLIQYCMGFFQKQRRLALGIAKLWFFQQWKLVRINGRNFVASVFQSISNEIDNSWPEDGSWWTVCSSSPRNKCYMQGPRRGWVQEGGDGRAIEDSPPRTPAASNEHPSSRTTCRHERSVQCQHLEGTTCAERLVLNLLMQAVRRDWRKYVSQGNNRSMHGWRMDA